MEDIGYSDAIPQVSSLVLATMEEAWDFLEAEG